MRHEEDVVAGAAIPCGATVLVPLLRVRAQALASFACAAEADVIGFVTLAGDATPRLFVLDDAQADAAAWLAARPTLAAQIRERLAHRG